MCIKNYKLIESSVLDCGVYVLDYLAIKKNINTLSCLHNISFVTLGYFARANHPGILITRCFFPCGNLGNKLAISKPTTP